MLWKAGGKRTGVVGLLAAMVLMGAGTAALAQHAAYDRTQDLVYGRKHGMALTLDVFAPRENKNGLGLIWVVSGGWFSSHEAIGEGFVQPFLDRGYTVFAVVHGSQPRFTIPEVLQDMHRAVRYIRHHAADYSIDPERLGIYGGSAGGHLSLMQGLAPEEQDADAKDPVERGSSRVAAVACFFPPTDFLNYGQAGENAIGRGVLKGFRAPFDFQEFDTEQGKFVPITDEKRILDIGRLISPISHVTADDVPTLIMHGNADQLVPIQQAEILTDKMKQEGVEARLVVKKGGAHGWPNLLDDLELFADWFDTHLRSKEAEKPEARPQPAAAPISSRAEQPPRKVRIASAIYGPYGEYPGLEARIGQLSELVDRMTEECRKRYEGRGLDLAILPETVVTSTQGTPEERAAPLEGLVQDRFSALARKHRTYLLVPLDLQERDDNGSFVSNAAVLFDREGKVSGVYRKVHPVATVGTDQLEGGVRPGADYPVFDCDFGKLGVQICWDIQFAEGWKTLAARGAEVVAWPTASPATVLPSARAVENRYYVVSSAWRDNATVYEPTGMVASRIEPSDSVLVHELDLSHAILGWASFLGNGEALTRKYGDRVGYHYSTREDVGLFWSNDQALTIGDMVRSIDGEEIDPQVHRNRAIYRGQKEMERTPPREVSIELRKPTDHAILEAAGNGLTIRIESPSGIGAARIKREGDEWPGQMRVKLLIAGLESLQIRTGTSRFEVVVPSQGAPVALITHEQEGGKAQAITHTGKEVPVIRLLDAQGRQAREVPFQGGSVEIVLPSALLAAASESIELEWVDFFR